MFDFHTIQIIFFILSSIINNNNKKNFLICSLMIITICKNQIKKKLRHTVYMDIIINLIVV